MGPHLHDDYKEIDFRAMMESEDDGEHPVSPQTRRNVEAFLGSGHIVAIPLSAPRYHCDLAGWALERQRQEEGWDAEQVIGHRVRKARYTRVSVAPGQVEALLPAGILFLKRGGAPVGRVERDIGAGPRARPSTTYREPHLMWHARRNDSNVGTAHVPSVVVCSNHAGAINHVREPNSNVGAGSIRPAIHRVTGPQL